jgi:hypothetical protein
MFEITVFFPQKPDIKKLRRVLKKYGITFEGEIVYCG